MPRHINGIKVLFQKAQLLFFESHSHYSLHHMKRTQVLLTLCVKTRVLVHCITNLYCRE